MNRPLVLHLNGAPAAGKSTLARLWADRYPGTLLLDIDVLCTWVSGWRDDFREAPARVRPAALALLSGYVASGGSVVLPQLLADPAEVARFRAAAEDAGGRWFSVLVEAPDVAARFAARPVDTPQLEAIHQLVGEAPGEQLAAWAERLAPLPHDATLATEDGAADAAYDRLVELVQDRAA